MGERFIIIGTEKSQCHTCYGFFYPTSDYHRQCESRTEFPPDFPEITKPNPHAFCSPECERSAIDESRKARIENERMLRETA